MQSESPTPVHPVQEISGSAPDKPPRALTPRMKRAIYIEPHVRRWWLLAGVILVLFTAYTAQRMWARNDEIKLIRDGMPITAYLASAENKNRNQPVDQSTPVHLILKFPDHHNEDVMGYLYNPSLVEQDIKVHVDPKDHTHWTDRSEPTPLLDSLFVGIMVFPLVPGLFLIAYLKMRETQTVWQTGSAQVAVIFDRKQSPIAPLSYSIRCSLQSGKDKKLFNVFVPNIGYGLARGDLIWVIMPVKKGTPISGLWMGCGSVQA